MIMQYGIVCGERNLFAELSTATPPPEDFLDEYCDDTVDDNYIFGDDVMNCGYEFLTKTVEPDTNNPIIKRREIKEIEDAHMDSEDDT